MSDPTQDYDVFANDLFAEEDNQNYPTIGRWGFMLLHFIKAAFVIYSAAHNIQASITATGDNSFALAAQIVGVLVLETTISALYMAGMAGKITGRLQAVLATLFWLIGMGLASAGIVVDSRLNVGYSLGDVLSWHLSTGLFIAPVIMVVGAVLVVFSDPVLSQQIANSRDRAAMQRQKVCAAVLADKAAHESRRIIYNIRLAAQRQMALDARQYYKSPEVQNVLKATAATALRDVMHQAGIEIPDRPVSSNVASRQEPLTGTERVVPFASDPTQETAHPKAPANEASGGESDGPFRHTPAD